MTPNKIRYKTIPKAEAATMDISKQAAELRKKYIFTPPEGMSPDDVKRMSDSDLLDMHYFLTEDDFDDDEDNEEGFYIF
jgi:hypothetical protein